MSFARTWMAWYGDDFWESERVAAMDDSAALLYSWLLWRQFKHGPLPSPDVLRRLPHRWGARWDRLWPQVADCFEVLEDGRLENPRCREVRDDALARAATASTNGKRGGRPKGSGSKPRENPGLSGSVSQAEPGPKPDESSDRTRSERTEHTACAPRTHAHEAPPSDPAPAPAVRAGPEELSRVAREQIAMHPPLDRPAMHAAAIRWEAHLRASCPKGVWPSSTWAKNLTTWERWGMDAAIVAIDTAIGSNSWTPYQPQHRDAPPPTAAAPKPDPAAARAAQDRAAREREVERRWHAAHACTTRVVGPDGVEREVVGVDARYPGHEAAERELRKRGLLNGHHALETKR